MSSNLIRSATHAGSWYTDDGQELNEQLETWLNQVPDEIQGVGKVPVPGARIIIAPHAGYSYSGPAAAWAYKSWDISKAKRIFILGPAHYSYFTDIKLSKCYEYETPLGNLLVDKEMNEELKRASGGRISEMSVPVDEEEHSIEMHIPYVYKLLEQKFGTPDRFPKIVPILVGNTSQRAEKDFGDILKPYLGNEENSFVISSDFCHWGTRFQYTYYLPTTGEGYSLRPSVSSHHRPADPPIWSSIEILDRQAIDSIETGKHDKFGDYLKKTGNTICGRHPIGVVMAGLDQVQGGNNTSGSNNNNIGKFKFVRYEQSSRCANIRDSSVSYASAFAVLG